ncbi:MAG: hypothetical protein KGL57_03610 [Burkholderiales bacterium]|nr:hypothetical protein [Burkholderiales bacterium]
MRMSSVSWIKVVGAVAASLTVASLAACGGGGSSTASSGGSSGGGTVTTSSITLPTSVEVVSAK